MVQRTIDRRGRKNWDDETRDAADKQVQNRRSSDRRQKADRRKVDLWAGDPTKVDRRKGERRKGDRRAETCAAKPPRPPLNQLRVRDMVKIDPNQISLLAIGSTIGQVIEFLRAKHIGLVIMTTAEGSLVGVISERDVIRAFAENGAAAYDMVCDPFVTRGIWTCDPDDSLLEVVKIMRDNKMRHVPVVENGILAGMLSTTDLIRCLAAEGG